MEGNRPINIYGDVFVKTSGTHGIDIASQRLDHLDINALEYALTLCDHRSSAVDIGCGSGIQGIRFSLLGIHTVLIDSIEINDRIERIKEILNINNLIYLKRDARTLASSDFPSNLKLAFSQRFIHYLTYREASRLIGLLSQKMEPDAHLFISASGIGSELGHDYPGADQPIQERFSLLAPAMAEKHGILERVCLYSEQELAELIAPHGFRADSVTTSEFGNIKGVFIKL